MTACNNGPRSLSYAPQATARAFVKVEGS